MSFDELRERWAWKAIANCPGRYVLSGARPDLSLEDLAGGAVPIQEYHSPRARDTVLVVVCEGGGLISYRRGDGSYCHTLNTAEGLARKLEQLGLAGE